MASQAGKGTTPAPAPAEGGDTNTKPVIIYPPPDDNACFPGGVFYCFVPCHRCLFPGHPVQPLHDPPQ